MTNKDCARLAFGMILGGVAAVALTKASLSLQSSVLRWIAYCVVTGVMINTQTGKRFTYLLAASFASACCLVTALLWMLLVGHGVISGLSGIRVDMNANPQFATVLICALTLVTVFGVCVSALARPAVVELLLLVDNMNLTKAKKIEAFLRILVAISGTLGILLL